MLFVKTINQCVMQLFLFISFFSLGCQLINNSIQGTVTKPGEGNDSDISSPPDEVVFSCNNHFDSANLELTGDGSLQKPHVICSPNQLLSLGLPENVDKLSANFELGRNIDMSEVSANFVPIGSFLTPFTGEFNGNKFKISELALNITSGDQNIGLFSAVKNAKIYDLVIENFVIDSGNSSGVGALAGGAYGASILQNISANNIQIVGTGSRVGGMIGVSTGSHDELYIDSQSSILVSNGREVGGLIGAVNCNTTSASFIYKSHSHAYVAGQGAVGGLVGRIGLPDDCGILYNNLPISMNKCSATGDVSGSIDKIGGLVGISDRVIIKDSWASGNVQGNKEVGGLVGEMSFFGTTYDRIIRCYASGSIIATGDHIGGLIGRSYSHIIDSYATGMVQGNQDVGGLIGYVYQKDIIRSFATGHITGNNTSADRLGGLVGFLNQSNVYSSYATGTATVGSLFGGLFGIVTNTVVIENSFWDKESSSLTNMCGLAHASCIASLGKTTSEMQNPSTFNVLDPLNWSFYGEIDSDTDYWIAKTNGYPKHYWSEADPAVDHPFQSGSGTLADPYIISTALQMNSVGRNFTLSSKHYKLINDINLSSQNASYIPWRLFSGSIDGDNYTLSQLTINSPTLDNQGLIGSLNEEYFVSSQETPISIKNLKISQFSVTGKNSVGSLLGGFNSSELTLDNIDISQSQTTGVNYVGLVAGSCKSIKNVTISNSQITGENTVGGACGRILGSFSNVHVDAQVTLNGVGTVGGGIAGSFVNYSESEHIGSNSSFTGSISGTGYIGGIVGSLLHSQLISVNSSAITTGVTFVGGLVGLVGESSSQLPVAKIEKSYVYLGGINAPLAASFVGGLVGSSTATLGLVIKNSYVNSPIIATGSQIGGLIGHSSKPLTITTSYMGTNLSITGSTDIGGFIGLDVSPELSILKNNFWNISDNIALSFSGDGRTPLNSEIIGVSLTQLGSKSTFTNQAWDFSQIWQIEAGVNNSFPIHQ